MKNRGITIFLATTLALFLLCVLVGVLYWLTDETLPINPVSIAVGLSLAYLLVSWRFYEPLQADQFAVRSILGKPYDTVTSGAPFVPLGLVGLSIYPVPTKQREFPGEPQNVYYPKDGESETPPAGSGLVRPLRITFASKRLTEESAENLFRDETCFPFKGKEVRFTQGTDNSEDGLMNSRITAVIFHFCRLRIYDPVRFTITVPPHEKTGDRLDEAFRQIQDEQEVALGSILPLMTAAQAMENIGWINAMLFRKVCRRIGAVDGSGNPVDDGHSDEWGIDLEGCAMKTPEFNHGLNKAITGVAESTFLAVSTVRAAEAAKKADILAGQAAARAAKDLEQKTLEGRAVGLEKVAKTLGTDGGKEALAAEVARTLGTSGNTIVVGADGLKELIGIVAAAKSAGREKK